jgi:hypothetical protein
MDLVDLVMGRQPRSTAPVLPETIITKAPKGVTWTQVTTRADGHAVRAKLAKRHGRLRTKRGLIAFAPGRHYIVDYGGGDKAVARRDIFERVYKEVGVGKYEKRAEIVYRYFTLPYAVTVNTLEGPEAAKAGDWIMEGTEGELYPISPDQAREIYRTL